MITLVYKEKSTKRTYQIPYRNINHAKLKAKNLFDKGYLGVKVVEMREKILYVPSQDE